EGISGRKIDRCPISLHFPVRGDRYRLPTGIVERDRFKRLRTLIGIWHPKKSPIAVERLIPRRGFTLTTPSLHDIAKRCERGVRGESIARNHLLVFPIGWLGQRVSARDALKSYQE